MTKGQKQVAEFMRFFGQGVQEKPTQLDEATAKLRAKLILEEAFETITKGLGLTIQLADSELTTEESTWVNENNIQDIYIDFFKRKEVDLVELADGLADLAYVGEFGTAVAAGIDLEPIQDIVHTENMKKAWTEDELSLAREKYPTAKVENYGGGLYRLIREDGKIIKSPKFVDPREKIEIEINRQLSKN